MPDQQLALAFSHHPLYNSFIQVKNRLAEKGFVCWIAGGAVRDMIIKRNPADFDLVTDATTDQIMELFPDALTVGASFGVVKIIINKIPTFDLATFRREADYVDGRRPSRVDFATPEEDARRRDFTVNALFWNDETKEVVDFVGGLHDISQRHLKCVGVAEVRFQEDHLRLLRLLRFAIQLDFSIDEETRRAAQAQIPSLDKISGERVWSEIEKMLPAIKWNDFFKNPFYKAVFYFVFQLKKDPTELSALCLTGNYGLVHLFDILLKLGESTETTFDRLRSRWHLSKSDLKLFETLKFARTHQMNSEEWLWEMEKNETLLGVLEFLSQIGEFEGYADIRTRFATRPEKLFSGHDLSGFGKGAEVGELLKKIRLFQFKQPDSSKSQILDYIKQIASIR